MQLPVVKFVFDRKKAADDFKAKDAKYKGLLQIEVYFDRTRRRYISTGIRLFSGQWHEQKWVINHPNSHNLNEQLRTLMQAVNDNLTKQISADGAFSLDRLLQAVSLIGGNELVDDAIAGIVEEYIALGKSYSSYMQFNALRSLLKDFGRIRYTGDLSLSNVNALDRFMRVAKKYGDNTIANYHAKLRRACNMLYLQDKLKYNPYNDFHIVKPKNDKVKYLTEDEIDRFKNYPLTKKHEIFVRDFCMFQTMTGLAFSDAVQLDIKDIEERNGKFVVVDFRVKTAEQYSIVILPPAMEILRKYGGNLDRYCLQHINTVLSHLSQRIIGKKVTTHCFRHSFATIALRHGVPIEYVSKMLGHTDIKTTQRYAKVLAQDVIEQADKLNEVFK